MEVTVRLIPGDCLEEIPKLVAQGCIVDAVCTDPPYHLAATAKRFGKAGSADAQFGRDGAHQRVAKGFMNSAWDTDIAFQQETWETIASIMRPGAFLLAFGGTRTYHRMTCAIEDAGFVVQDCLMFLYGTGFPKRRDMLKPAYEPIVMAYKPGGARTLQVDECRISTNENLNGGAYAVNGGRKAMTGDERTGAALGLFQPGKTVGTQFEQPPGRWPANCVTDGSDEVVGLFPESTTGNLDRSKITAENRIFGKRPKELRGQPVGDSGSAARFFFSAKAGAQDRWGSKHPTVKPIELMKWLVALVTPPDGTCLDPFAGSGTTGVAALATGRNAVLIERESTYCADIRERLAFYEGGGSHSVQAKNRNRAVDHGPLFAGEGA